MPAGQRQLPGQDQLYDLVIYHRLGFWDLALQASAKIAILIASTLATVIGYALLLFNGPRYYRSSSMSGAPAD